MSGDFELVRGSCDVFASAHSRQACREQAQSRFTLCMKYQPVPDLIYYLG